MGLFMWIESTSVPPKWARGGSWKEGVSCFVFLFFYRKPIKKMRSSWSFLSSWVTSRLQPGQTSLHIIHILNTTVVHIHHYISPSTCVGGIYLLYSFFPSFYYISTESEWTPPPAGFFSVLHLILKLHQTQNEWNQSRNEATWICFPSFGRISLETLDAELHLLTSRTHSVEESIQRDTELLQQLDSFLQVTHITVF